MLAHRSLALYGGHDDEINCLVFSHDLEILLTGSVKGFIRLWNRVFDHLTFKIHENTGPIRALTISNNDRYFASTANDTNIRLYETRTGRLLHILTGHTHSSDCLQFSNDDQLIASGAWDCRTILWNVITGEQVYNLHHHTSAVQSISFHPNLNLMATGSHDHIVFLYDFDKPLPVTPVMLQAHYGNIHALAFSKLPYLASAGWDKIICIWKTDMGRIHARLFGHTGWIQAVTFRDDDGSILASVDDENVRVWNIFNGDCLNRLSIVNDLTCFVRFLPDNRGLLVGGAVYELLADQWVRPQERSHSRHIHEPITNEDVLMPKQKKSRSKQSDRDKSAKTSATRSRPSTSKPVLQNTIPVEEESFYDHLTTMNQ